MDSEEVIRMAAQVSGAISLLALDELERFASLVAAAERERAAKWIGDNGQGDLAQDILCGFHDN